jgi:hypothetical protein
MPHLFLQACARNTDLQRLVQQGFTPEYLARKAKKADPTLKVGIEILRPEYTAEEKLRRYNFCLSMLEQPPEFLQSIVWIDESSVPIDPAALTYIGTKGQYYTRTDPRRHKDKRQITYIHYILAVCYAHGLVHMDVLSFTHEYHDSVQYYVSAAARHRSPAMAQPCCAAHSLCCI